MAERLVCELVARVMKEEGVTGYFGVHGGHINAFIVAAEAAGGMKLYHMRHEQSGVYAADGWARASGKVGVCFGTAGPGFANMLPALVHAYLCRSPIVAFAGQHSTSEDSWGPFQESYADKICGNFTKWVRRIIDPALASYFVQKAFRDAASYPPGPVVVEIPRNILTQVVDEKAQGGYLPKGRCVEPMRPGGDPAGVEKAVRILLDAKKPVIIGGDGIFWSRASDELKELVELLNVPVHTRRMGRGAVPETHQLAFGGGYRRPILMQADVIALFGLRMTSLEHFGLPPVYPAENVKYIQVSEDFEELTTRLPTDVSIFGSPKVVLQQMIDCARGMTKTRPDRAEWLALVSEAKRNDKRKNSEKVDKVRNNRPIHPDFLASEIVDFLDHDATIILDSFSMSNFATDKIAASFAGQVLDAGTDGGVGHGVGMAIGAQLARPGKQVINLLGDGGLGIAGWDIETAARYHLPICYLLFNNSSWATGMDRISPLMRPELIKMQQDIRYDEIFARMDCHTELVTEPEQIRPAMDRAFNSGRTSLINVIPDASVISDHAVGRRESYRNMLSRIVRE